MPGKTTLGEAYIRVLMTEKLRRRLDAVAAADEKSISQVVRDAIKKVADARGV